MTLLQDKVNFSKGHCELRVMLLHAGEICLRLGEDIIISSSWKLKLSGLGMFCLDVDDICIQVSSSGLKKQMGMGIQSHRDNCDGSPVWAQPSGPKASLVAGRLSFLYQIL